RSGLAGKASIGTVVTPGTGLVPTAVATLKRRNPRILVSIDLDHSEALVARLVAGDLDGAVARIRDAQTAADLDFEPLGDEPQSVIARVGHPLGRKRGLGVADLARQGWVPPPAANALRDELDALSLEQGLDPPTNVLEASSLPVVISLLSSTDMVVSLPKEAVRPYCDAGVLTVLPVTIDVRMESFG